METSYQLIHYLFLVDELLLGKLYCKKEGTRPLSVVKLVKWEELYRGSSMNMAGGAVVWPDVELNRKCF